MEIRTIVDCGANRGQFARYISDFFPRASIYCFEPLDEPFRDLADWAETQGDRIICHKLALGDENGEVTMHHHVEHSPSSSLLNTTQHVERLFPKTREQRELRVPVATLNKVLAPVLDKLEPEILLKLDVQGYEDRVLRGATTILPKVRACLLEVCVDPLYASQAKFCDLITLLDQHGFNYSGNLDQKYEKSGRIMWLDALFLRS